MRKRNQPSGSAEGPQLCRRSDWTAAGRRFLAITSSGAPLRTLTIVSSGAPLAWTATGTASFLSLGSASGTTPGSTFVEVRVVGLSPGTYTGSVVVSATGGGTVSVPVSVTVTSFNPGGLTP